MLNMYCNRHQLPKPVYKTVNCYSSVMVGSRKYSSYPQEANSKDEAEKFAAEKALKELGKYNIKSSTIVTSDQASVVKWIEDMEAHAVTLREPENLKLNMKEFWLQEEGPQEVYISYEKAICDFPLKAPVVPSIGSFFDVRVTMAAHPGNFKIQILQNLNKLETLEEELSRYCESYSDSSLTVDSIKDGNMYAAKGDESDRWYRAYVSRIMSNNTTCVIYFCDYGFYKVVPINQLRPLKKKFYDLPYQAIKAALYRITPKLKGDWTENDSRRLNQLIANKTLYAEIKSCEKERTEQMILGLELIEKSTPNNIFIIRDVLINENIADELT